MKFRNLAKLYIFKLIKTKSNLKNSYDVSLVTSSPLRHCKTPPKLHHKFPIPPPPIKSSGYASDLFNVSSRQQGGLL